MSVALFDQIDIGRTVEGSELSLAHFEAAEQVSDRRCIEMPAVCEVPLGSGERAIVIPYLICARGPSGLHGLPRLTAPDLITAEPLDSENVLQVRRRLVWIRLVDALCGGSPAKQSAAMLQAFVKLHGLPRVPVAPIVECHAQWRETGAGVGSLLKIVIDALSSVRTAEAAYA